jgi:hypothetical protein
MALPKVDEKVQETVAVTEAVTEAVTATEPAPAPVSEPEAEVSAEPVSEPEAPAVVAEEPSKAVATRPETVNAMQVLADQGITDIKLDFTSFTKVTLEKGQFSSDEHKNFGSEFLFRYMDKHPTYLLTSVPPDRTTEPELVYSNDGETEASTGKHFAEFIAEWKEKGWDHRKTTYDIVIGECLSGPHKDEFVQLQVSPTSQGLLGGYLYSMAMQKKDIRSVVARVAAGTERGSGTKSFTPWTFKEVKNWQPEE